MKTHSPLFLLAALGLLAGTGAATAAADTSNWQCKTCPYPKTATTGHVEAGLTTVSEDSAKFGDMTGLNEKGAKLNLGGAVSVRTPSGYYADLVASDLGLDSRSLWLQSGHAGTYDVRLGYSELPRYLSSGAMTPFQGAGGSVLTLPAGYPAASTAGMPLASTLQPVELGYKKKHLDLSARLLSIHNWTLRAGYSRDVRSGTRASSGSFFSSAAQLVLPVDQVTDQVEVSAAYASRSFQAQLGYQVSRFTNDVSSLTWTSPLLARGSGCDHRPTGPGAQQPVAPGGGLGGLPDHAHDARQRRLCRRPAHARRRLPGPHAERVAGTQRAGPGPRIAGRAGGHLQQQCAPVSRTDGRPARQRGLQPQRARQQDRRQQLPADCHRHLPGQRHAPEHTLRPDAGPCQGQCRLPRL
jgi:hypothetical protein